MSKPRLYIATVVHLKPSQVFFRVWRKLGGPTPLRPGYRPKPQIEKAGIDRIPVLTELDFDPAFLGRFDVDGIVNDRIKLLHHEEHVDWCTSWHAELSTPLWRFNLHYHEYLLPLAKAYRDTGDDRCLNKAKSIVNSWIVSCPRKNGGVAWDPYVISVRIVNWLAFLAETADSLVDDRPFIARVNASLAEQYVHLSQHLEKDLLANHYLENLKALVVLACYFDDEETLVLALGMLQKQVNEQILPDGMHFELSPMYHKVVLEDLLRTAAFLGKRGEGVSNLVERFHLQSMCDALWSMERGTNRTPLFNDSGDNVAKSRDALLTCANRLFNVKPNYNNVLHSAGYVFLERKTDRGTAKVVFDAGKPGPEYAAGHAHCDVLSFECFFNGTPWIVNCGTYAYQGDERLNFKKTLSHNTLRVGDKEQHECWASFRVAGRSKAHLIEAGTYRASGTLIQRNSSAVVKRTVSLEENGVLVHDEANCSLEVWAAFIFANDGQWIQGENGPVPYAPDFGLIRPAYCVKSKIQKRHLTTFIPYPNFIEGESGGDAVEDHLRGEFSAALWRRDSKKRSTLQASFIEDGDRKARPVSDETS